MLFKKVVSHHDDMNDWVNQCSVIPGFFSLTDVLHERLDIVGVRKPCRDPGIQLTSDESETRFEWSGFDGDDCFSDFHVTIMAQGRSRRFDFGPCVA